MSLPRYPAYKDSGVSWLGEVPAHWEVWKLTHAFPVIGSGTTPKSDNDLYYADGDIPWVNTGDLNDSFLLSCKRRVNYFGLSEHSSLRLYKAGSVVIAMYGATIGKLAIPVFDFTVNQACCVFDGSASILPKYLFYWLMAFRSQIVSLATGGGQPNISQEILSALRIAAPAMNEQSEIAGFLDRETAKIDALIAEQEKLIALLAEKRQATISRAVTRGLDPNVPLKDSGVPWLGKVPAHWEVTALKRFWAVTDCKHVTAEFVETGFPLASIREVQSRYVDLREAKQTSQHFYDLLIEGGRKPQSGDLIFSRNATVGEVSQVTDEHPKFALGQDVCLLRKKESSYSSDFLQAVIQSRVVVEQLGNIMVGSTFKRVNVEDIRGLVIAMPPSNEQADIAIFIEREVKRLENLNQSSCLVIELLKERRAALISAAVTGKVDVRGLAA